MPVYERSTVVDAPLETVWQFHSDTAGLEALTPSWLDLRIESVTGPDDDPDPDVLEAGSTITSSIRPLGIGPRQRWVSAIRERRRRDHAALFRDEMVDGPFPHWVHTHRFESVDGGTRVHDRVEYRLPGGPLGRLLGPLGWIGFEPMFRHRHVRTKELLE